MLTYIKAEHLKCKHLFLKKLIVLGPLITLVMAYFSGMYFVANGFNWWYTLLFPGMITLTTALVNQIEERKMHYRGISVLPISLKKIWVAKIIVISFYITIAALIHMIGILIGKMIYNCSSPIPLSSIVSASMLLILTMLWQIPSCLFLSKKFGTFITLLINFGAGTVLNMSMASSRLWIFCPYSWSTRLMCPVLHVLPNGLLAEAGDALLDTSVIPLGIFFAVLLYILLAMLTAAWFSKQEVK